MKKSKAFKKDVVDSQAGWRMKSDQVDLFITENGGHLAPVNFYTDSGKPIQPYYISPWQNEKLGAMPDPVLIPLRGDFFCMPFGGNSKTYKGEKHSGHGEVSSSKWKLKSQKQKDGITELALEMNTKVRKGKVTKKTWLVDGQNAVYNSHIIQGYSGSMPLGHHCTLAVPEKEGSLNVTVSPFKLGMTNPGLFSDPKNAEYQSLAINEKFKDLTKVPVMAKGEPDADCSSFPQREGYEDLIQVFKKPTAKPAWTAVACPSEGYLWYSLKDAAVLPGTVFWISNKGRHSLPWNGRNRCLGMEETCSFFAEGLAPSVQANFVNKKGIPTAVKLSPTKPTMVNLIQGVVKIPKTFKKVKEVKFSQGQVTFISEAGKEVTADVNWEFLKTGGL